MIEDMIEYKGTDRGIYLASPYSHPDHKIQYARFRTVTKVSAYMSSLGIPHFGPITQSKVEVDMAPDILTGSWKQWAHIDTIMLRLMDDVWVVNMPGAIVSEGVKAEVALAFDNGQQVKLITPKWDATVDDLNVVAVKSFEQLCNISTEYKYVTGDSMKPLIS